MSTKVYGCSDDLIEFEGDFRGEVGCYSSDNDPVLVVLSDGTLLEVKYGKGDRGIWSVALLSKGSLFDRIDQCDDEDADPCSDVAHFREGIKWAHTATEWGAVS
jgi:hypothetical protein